MNVFYRTSTTLIPAAVEPFGVATRIAQAVPFANDGADTSC